MTDPPPARSSRIPSPDAPLSQENRLLRERLAYYEGFDALISDQLTQARELFRLAAQEREASTLAADAAHLAWTDQEAAFRQELSGIAADLHHIVRMVDSLSQRVAQALGDLPPGVDVPAPPVAGHQMSVVVHGVPSARSALALQRYLAAAPSVTTITAREFAGGILRLDAQVREPLRVGDMQGWDDRLLIQALTERPDVLEIAIGALAETQLLSA